MRLGLFFVRDDGYDSAEGGRLGDYRVHVLTKVRSVFQRGSEAIGRFVRLHRSAPRSWGHPGRADIVVFDAMSSDLLLPAFPGRPHLTVYTRGERLVLWPGVIARMGRNMLSGASPMEAYSLAVLQCIRPKVVITHIDNNSAFSYAAARYPAAFVAVQNGTRTMINEAPSNPKDVVLPTFFCLGQNDVDQFTTIGAKVGEFRMVGTLRNEAYLNSPFSGQWPERYDVCLISEIDRGLEAFPWLGKSIGAMAANMAAATQRLSLSVVVAARSNPATDPERFAFEADFYRQHFGGRLTIVPNVPGEFTSYRLIDNSDVAAGFCSTALYEAAGRGRRIFTSSATPGFYDFPAKAPWSLVNPTSAEFEAALHRVHSTTDADFHKQYASELAYLFARGVKPVSEIAAFIDQVLGPA